MITKKEIENLGWSDITDYSPKMIAGTKSYKWILKPKRSYDDIYYELSKPHNTISFPHKDCIYRISEIDESSINLSTGHHSRDLLFRGKLISDNPKQELLTIMKQIGIIP